MRLYFRAMAFAALFCICLSSRSGVGTEQSFSSFKVIGIYGWTTSRPDLVPFLKFCGYNTWQFIDTAWSLPPGEHEQYYNSMAAGIKALHREGFKVYGIINANIRQYRGGAADEGYQQYFPLSDKVALKERLAFVREGVVKLKDADGFVFFAGDPGSDHSPGSTELSAVAFAKEVQAIVADEAPHAEFAFNAWSITAWGPHLSALEPQFWIEETRRTKKVLAQTDFVGADIGIEFPMHNYYRALARKCLLKAGQNQPELYPTHADIAELRARRVRYIVGWPYFLIDECDDHYSGGSWGQAQSETRYIRELVVAGHRLALDGMIGNISNAGGSAELANLFAFAKFCKDPATTPEQALHEFAAIVAEKKSVNDFAQVLMFIENQSTAQQFMPPAHRLPDFTCEIKNAESAQMRLAAVTLNDSSEVPLPESRAKYMKKLKHRLEIIAADKGSNNGE